MAIQRLKITRTDGTEIVVTPNLGDTLNFETTLRKNPQWGKLEDNALKAGPFRAWSAGRREGTVTESWDEFVQNTSSVDVAEDAAPAEEDTDLGLGTAATAPTTY